MPYLAWECGLGVSERGRRSETCTPLTPCLAPLQLPASPFLSPCPPSVPKNPRGAMILHCGWEGQQLVCLGGGGGVSSFRKGCQQPWGGGGQGGTVASTRSNTSPDFHIGIHIGEHWLIGFDLVPAGSIHVAPLRSCHHGHQSHGGRDLVCSQP